jgi:hypothetical protein
MNDMFKKVNAREKLIGWYHSGPKLRASDLQINELFKKYTPNPLLVIIDVQPKDVGVPTDAYFAVEEIKDVRIPIQSKPSSTANVIYDRTAPPPPEPSSTRPAQSKRKKQKKSASNTSSATSGMLQPALSPPA